MASSSDGNDNGKENGKYLQNRELLSCVSLCIWSLAEVI